MNDKIWNVEKKLRNIVKDKSLTQTKKYDLARKIIRKLSKRERKILIKKCRRDYELYIRSNEAMKLISLFVTWIGIFFSIFAIYSNNKDVSITNFENMLAVTLVYGCVTIMGVAFFETWRNGKIRTEQYMIDLLEVEQNCD